MPRENKGRMDDIIRSMRKIAAFCNGKARKDLDTDEMLALSLVRLLEIIGEAVKNLPPETTKRYPDIPWGEFARLRDKLIHGYFSVDYDIVWNIVNKEVPGILRQIDPGADG